MTRTRRTLKDIREQARAGAARAREKKIAEGLRRVQIWVLAAEVDAAAKIGLAPRQLIYAAQAQLENVIPLVITSPTSCTKLEDFLKNPKA